GYSARPPQIAVRRGARMPMLAAIDAPSHPVNNSAFCRVIAVAKSLHGADESATIWRESNPLCVHPQTRWPPGFPCRIDVPVGVAGYRVCLLHNRGSHPGADRQDAIHL